MKPGSEVRITREFGFEMAHALHGHDGPCRNIHGHSYRLSVTVSGIPVNKRNHPKDGMVMDFTDLKKIVQEVILDKLDHALVLNRHSPIKEKTRDASLYGKVLYTDFQPTCENLLLDFAQALQKKLPSNIRLHHLKLRETPSSYAEWYADENK